MKHNSHIVKWALIISIVIIANLFINYSVSLVLTQPVYDDFCGDIEPASSVETKAQCDVAGGEWQEFNMKRTPDLAVEGYCDVFGECSQLYDDVREEYERNVFVSLISIGVVLFVLSLILKANYVVITALALAAVLDFVIASIRYWSTAENITRVSILALALAVLIYIAYKKFKDE